MHIVIGIMTALAGLIWAIVALQRAGVDLNSLNPFLWQRRSQWKKKYGDKPLYILGNPMEAAAVLLLGTAKCEGEISAEQKQDILAIFEQEFHLGRDEAADLLLASSHLLRNEVYLADNLDKILAKSAAAFSPDKVNSLLVLMQRVAAIESAANAEQDKLIAATRSYFDQLGARRDQW